MSALPMLKGLRVRALHLKANRSARKAAVMTTASKLLAELPKAERDRLAKRHRAVLGSSA